MLTASSSLQQRITATLCSELQLRLCSLFSSTFVIIPSWLPPFYLANHGAVSPGKTLATNSGCKRRNNAVSPVFKELLSFQLPSQPFTVALRFGREWRSRETWRLSLSHCSSQPCPSQGSPAAIRLPLFSHPSALVWPLGFLRGKAPMDKLSVERHNINEGRREREEKRTSDRDSRNKPSWSTYVLHWVKAYRRAHWA